MRLVILAVICWACTSKTGQAINGPQQSDTVSSSQVARAAIIDTIQFDYEAQFRLENYLTEADSDAQVIDFDCAILIYPNDAQIEELKKRNGEENFFTIVDDNEWYQAQAIGILDSLQVKKISPEGKLLRIINNDRTWKLDIRRKNLPAWNIILFKSSKEPRIVSSIDVTAELVIEYFELGK